MYYTILHINILRRHKIAMNYIHGFVVIKYSNILRIKNCCNEFCEAAYSNIFQMKCLVSFIILRYRNKFCVKLSCIKKFLTNRHVLY